MASTFSEHWHRVAHQRLALHPAVQTRKQWFRGDKWFLVMDPWNNSFFRVSPGAHDFMCRLAGVQTTEEVWEQCLVRDPENAPGQEEVIALLSQLHRASLLRGEGPGPSELLGERQRKRRRGERRAWLNLASLRIPLWDPDRFLVRAMPAVRWLWSPLGAALWLVTIGWAVKVAADHADELAADSSGVLAPHNLPLLYGGLVAIKLLHELGHAFACRQWGGEVHRMGVMLMYFSPVPYVDATASWAFRSKWRRIAVGAAGMLAELWIAALALFVWAATGEGAIHSLAYNLIFVASTTTLFFNINPLLRYDGYYMLSDWLEVPNLAQRSSAMLQYAAERWLYGIRSAESPARNPREGALLASYGVASQVYRIILFTGIALWVADQFLLLGVVLAAMCVWSFSVKPLVGLLRYLAASPRLGRQRRRAILVTASLAAAALLVLGGWPVPRHVRAPGVLRAEQMSEVFTATPGLLREVLAASGSTVQAGQPLVRGQSREVELQAEAARADLAKARAEEERALQRNAAALPPLLSRRRVAERRVERVAGQEEALLLRAPHAGVWISPRLEDRLGQWLPRGERVGLVVQPGEMRFTAVIPQDAADSLFTGTIRAAEVRLTGTAGALLPMRDVRVIPAEQERLPSAALGWAGGGEVATRAADLSGTRAAEPFFELRGTALVLPGHASLQGRSGKIRLTLGREPLAIQWGRKLRQLLQRRYHF